MANAKIKTSELTIKDSPSTSATLVGVDNGETVQIPISAFGSSGGGIVTVDALPAEGEVDTIYKVEEFASLQMVEMSDLDQDGIWETMSVMPSEVATIEIVDELPEVGKNYVDIDAILRDETKMHLYYLKADGCVHFYYSQELADFMNSNGAPATPVTVGWDTAGNSPTPFTVVYSLDECTDTSGQTLYGLGTKKSSLYYWGANGFEQLVTKSELNSNTSGSSSGGGIVTVDALPTEGVVNTIYKVYEVDALHFIDADEEGNVRVVDYTEVNSYVEIVEELPDTGVAYIDLNTDFMYMYYNRTDSRCYGYITTDLAIAFQGQIPEGWLCVNDIKTINVISSLDQLTDTSGETLYLFEIKKPHLYIYENRWIEIPIGYRMVHNPILETMTFIET